jgi:hypothetical protein
MIWSGGMIWSGTVPTEIDATTTAVSTTRWVDDDSTYAEQPLDPALEPTPEPTAEPTSEPTVTAASTSEPEPLSATLHVGDLEGTAAWVNRAKWRATITIVVHDAGQNPVAGAAVSGSWSGGYTGLGTCTTDSAGTCSVISSNIGTKADGVLFTVDSVSHTDYVYEAAHNGDLDGDSDGTSITLAKPY